jgi:hypothetical protein
MLGGRRYFLLRWRWSQRAVAWFYIQLPSGTYKLKATFKGETKQIKNFRVTKDKVVQQTLIWDLGKRAEP